MNANFSPFFNTKICLKKLNFDSYFGGVSIACHDVAKAHSLLLVLGHLRGVSLLDVVV